MRAGRWTVAVLCGAMLTAACSGGDEDKGDTSASATSTTNADGTTVPGTTVQVGDPIVVAMTAKGKGASTVRLTVTAVKTGSIKDLSDFQLTPEAKSSTVYYVDVSVANLGKGDLGGTQLTLYGKVSDTLVVQPVRFGSTFAKCNDQPLPTPFGKGKKAKDCLVMLAPKHGQISQVQWRGPGDEAPISWDVAGSQGGTE
jgi:hypothetical protein